MKFFEWKMRLIAPLVVLCCLIGVVSQVAQAEPIAILGGANQP